MTISSIPARLKVLILAAVLLLLAQGGGSLFAGFPAKCEKPPCGMKMCAAMGKNGKPNGMNCSHRCTKQCCLCAKSCPRDEYRGDPEESNEGSIFIPNTGPLKIE